MAVESLSTAIVPAIMRFTQLLGTAIILAILTTMACKEKNKPLRNTSFVSFLTIRYHPIRFMTTYQTKVITSEITFIKFTSLYNITQTSNEIILFSLQMFSFNYIRYI